MILVIHQLIMWEIYDLIIDVIRTDRVLGSTQENSGKRWEQRREREREWDREERGTWKGGERGSEVESE